MLKGCAGWISAGLMLVLSGVLAERAEAYPMYPRRYVSRPLWLPKSTLRFDAAFPLLSVDRPGGDRINTFSALLGLGLGLTPDLEVGAVFLPLQLTEKFDYRNPSLYGSYRLLNTDILDIAFRADVSIPADDYREPFNGAVMPFLPWFGDLAVGIPLRLRIADALMIDTGAHFGVVFTDPLGTRINVPLKLAIQVTDTVFFGPQTGIQVANGDNATIPFGLFMGANFGSSSKPLLDLIASFQLPEADHGFDEFVVGLGLNMYLFL
ncbi:MAG: hypothetical protein H6715_06750 [Myxococcales bacterium]|nr:hypothetical protein [Myxococcales bacterium]MCB9708247.1 hypothetical protein [Myxococcales bacterium]